MNLESDKWTALEKTHVFPVKPLFHLNFIRMIVAEILIIIGFKHTVFDTGAKILSIGGDHVMNNFFSRLFPKIADNNYKGSKIALWMFMLLAVVSTGRSLIHFLAPDGGAGSIAGLDLSKGAENIIFSFGLWGLSQLIYAFIQLLVAFRYRSLIPLFYLILFFETIGRMAVGRMKIPILQNGIPPGGIANYILLPLSILMFILSLKLKKAE